MLLVLFVVGVAGRSFASSHGGLGVTFAAFNLSLNLRFNSPNWGVSF